MDLKCPFHHSTLKPTNISSTCNACYEDHHDNNQGYKCHFCNFYVHEECLVANIPSRHKHPLKLLALRDRGATQSQCCLCESYLFGPILSYRCAQCSIYICVSCARKPLIIAKTKVHEHELHQIPIMLSFTCDACGLCSSGYPCVCLQCCFIIHRECVKLPRVIYINRHNHRISYVRPLGPGNWTCGICRKHVNGECGAYSCLVCPYVVHSKCATNRYNWDGRELEGVPEEEESKPFQVIDQNLIKHFSHEHNLMLSVSSSRLDEDALPGEEDKHCDACTLPIDSNLCYKCTKCDFILHDECANLPPKKRHAVSTTKLTLYIKAQPTKKRHAIIRYPQRATKSRENYFQCNLCRRYCTGFSYSDDYYQIDVRCASVSDTFKHESHPHLLFVVYYDRQRCKVCEEVSWRLLRCIGEDDCGGFNLCFRCATLPTSVRHKYDDHPLSLCYGEENANSTYFCGICEEEVNSKSWFYKCNDCCSTLHTKCVFNNLMHSRPGNSLQMGSMGTFDLLPNNSLSRPICYLCGNRCKGDLVLNNKTDKNICLCCSCSFPED